jgi:acetyltransferase-like isoleucine patch superfamily enzyme
MLTRIKRLIERQLQKAAGVQPPVIIPSYRENIPYLAKLGAGVKLRDTVNFGGINHIGENTYIQGGVSFGYATTTNVECWLRGPVMVGNYCQLGPRVCLHAVNHNYAMLTTYSNRNLFEGRLKDHNVVGPIHLQHGIWCGYGAIILKSVTIGNGAVIGAGAVVTRDIPAYTIAVGSPAHPVGQRYDDEICELIENTRWWLHSIEQLRPWEPVFHMDLKRDREIAVDRLREMAVALGSVET